MVITMKIEMYDMAHLKDYPFEHWNVLCDVAGETYRHIQSFLKLPLFEF